jgi:Peptidase family M23/Palmitoyl protein thioesterase
VARATTIVTNSHQGFAMHKLLASAAVVLLLPSSAAGAPPRATHEVITDPAMPWLVPPVDGVVGRRFQAPQTDWGPGHRGIDYLLPSARDVSVRAAANGHVRFAGEVAGLLAVSIEHAAGLETTYSQLSELYVDAGDRVVQGMWIGRAGTAHGMVDPVTGLVRSDDGAGLHFGVKVEGAYVDPEDYLGPVDASGAIYLAPLVGDWSADFPNYSAGSYLSEECRAATLLDPSEPPNDNIAVVIAGIATETERGADEPVFGVPAALGYEPHRTYRFSYKGSDFGRLHEPYDRTDTYQSIRSAAGKLATMLIRVARRHPGAEVDLIAHSQGGLIARFVLEKMAVAWQRGWPRVDHLVSFATPHRGTRIAGASREIEEGTITGRWALGAVSEWARRGGPVPDPRSDAVSDAMPGSRLLDELAAGDVILGTRALALSAITDLLVPPNRAEWPGRPSRVVGPVGLNAHSAVLRSPAALRLASAWLRDAVPECHGSSDHLGTGVGTAVDAAEWWLPELYSAGEEWLLKRAWQGLVKRRER